MPVQGPMVDSLNERAIVRRPLGIYFTRNELFSTWEGGSALNYDDRSVIRLSTPNLDCAAHKGFWVVDDSLNY